MNQLKSAIVQQHLRDHYDEKDDSDYDMKKPQEVIEEEADDDLSSQIVTEESVNFSKLIKQQENQQVTEKQPE